MKIMKQKLFFFLLFSTLAVSLFAQADTKKLRIVDTLTPQEKRSRNPILLRSEIDSLIKLHEDSLVKIQPQQIVKKEEKKDYSVWLITEIGLVLLIVII